MKSIVLSENKSPYKKIITQEFSTVLFGIVPCDIILMDVSDFDGTILFNSSRVHNNSFLVIDSIYKNKKHLNLWAAIKKRPDITVTIDLFYCGIVFFRKEQAKEHFKIRI